MDLISTKTKVTIGIVAAILLFFILCFRTVGAGQVGIVTRFGEIDRVASSGIAIKLPWPIEKLEKMEIRVQKEEQTAAAATADLQDVNAKLALNYALDGSTALRVYKELGKDYKDRVVTPAVQESFKSATSGFTASDLITRRAEVKAKAYEVIKTRIEKYGIRVVDLNIVNFSFSPEFNKAIEAKQVALQSAEKAVYDTQKIEQEAKGAIAFAQGQAESQRIVRETITPELLQKQAIEKWDGKMPTYWGGQGNIFNIPLNR
jgi:regulator of protease activity HflC (stomatin/prohibitin superfamily)